MIGIGLALFWNPASTVLNLLRSHYAGHGLYIDFYKRYIQLHGSGSISILRFIIQLLYCTGRIGGHDLRFSCANGGFRVRRQQHERNDIPWINYR
jgi:hypothetical protein